MRFAIHDGILANDVVGFHSDRWRQNFLDCVRDIVGDAGGVRAITAPVSVDVAEFEQLAGADDVLAAEAEIVARRPEKLVVRVDRTDPSKNIVRGFRAFELYLEAHPEMHRRVGMLALLDPSRQDVPEYAEYVGAVQREARRVNDRFAGNGWTPIEVQIEDDFPRSVAAYKQFDVLLVNATMDGMNLVAKEAPLVNERDGVLLLSENTGAFAELGTWALPINPFDVGAQADAIHLALTMEQRERRWRLEAIRAHVRENDIHAWIELQLAALDEVPAAQR
jgi:trehalose 6-phosphate synthase